MDPRCTPQPVGTAHVPDQVTDLPADRWTATSGPRFPAPQGPELPPMPSNQCLGPDDRDNFNDRRTTAIEPDECQPVCIGHPERAQTPADAECSAADAGLSSLLGAAVATSRAMPTIPMPAQPRPCHDSVIRPLCLSPGGVFGRHSRNSNRLQILTIIRILKV